MRKNLQDVLNSWKDYKRNTKYKSIWTDGHTIYSYNTILVQKYHNPYSDTTTIYFNHTKYSVTTTIHQNALYHALRDLYPKAYFVKFDNLRMNMNYFPQEVA